MSRASLIAALLLTCAGIGPAQTQNVRSLAKGRLLVADASLRDPNFFETVILLLNYDEEGALGLVINRPTPIRLAKLLPQIPALEGTTETAYLGGPVETGKMFILIRGDESIEETEKVLDGVRVSTSATLLEKLSAGDAGRFRGYAGYAGWGPGQLDGEVEDGAWHILPANAATVFDPDPAQVWKRLADRAQTRIAEALGLRLRL